MAIFHNTNTDTEPLPPLDTTAVQAFHSQLPTYAKTPLTRLPEAVAREIGVKAIFVKDESSRFDTGSFKILGASWGMYCAVTSRLRLPRTVTLADLTDELQRRPVTVFAATDGNHGKAVMFMARLLLVDAVVLVPKDVDKATYRQMQVLAERYSAEMEHGTGQSRPRTVRVTQCTRDYDRTVREASDQAENQANGILVQDTAFPGYEEIPAWIVEGYSSMLKEADDELAATWDVKCDVVVTPVGVGSLAHAVVKHYKSSPSSSSSAADGHRRRHGRRTTVIAVEPDVAACLYASMEARKSVTVETSPTIMEGMNCGTVSSTAFADLQTHLDVSATVSDYDAHMAGRVLAKNNVRAGPCGAAAFAALCLCRWTCDPGSPPVLNDDAVVLLLNTERPREYQTPAMVRGSGVEWHDRFSGCVE